MSDAREQLALRNSLQMWLEPGELRAANWAAVIDASTAALRRGWTGNELARWVCAALAGAPPFNIGAVIHATLTRLGETDPPRDVTPAPEPFDSSHHAAGRANAARDPSQWARLVRAQAGIRGPAAAP